MRKRVVLGYLRDCFIDWFQAFSHDYSSLYSSKWHEIDRLIEQEKMVLKKHEAIENAKRKRNRNRREAISDVARTFPTPVPAPSTDILEGIHSDNSTGFHPKNANYFLDESKFHLSANPKQWMKNLEKRMGTKFSVIPQIDASRFMVVWRMANKMSQAGAAKKLKVSVRVIKRVEAIGRWPKHLRSSLVENAEAVTPTHLRELADRKLSESQLEHAIDRILAGKYPFTSKLKKEPEKDLETLKLEDGLQKTFDLKKLRLTKLKRGKFEIKISGVDNEYLEGLLCY